MSIPGTRPEDVPRRRSTFPGTGTLSTTRALSSGPRPLGEVDASAPSSPRAAALPSGGWNVPRVWLLVLYSLSFLFATLGASSPCSQFHSDPITCLGAQIPAFPRPRPRLGLGGALQPGPAPPLSPLPPLSRLPRHLQAPELPFRTRNPPNLGWTPFCCALPPASPRPLRSCNLEAQLSTSGDFSLLSSPQAKFPERSPELRAFTAALGVRTRGASAAAARR